MTIFYSSATRGFYRRDIHGEGIPLDAVEVNQVTYEALLAGQAEGMLIVPDDAGYPVLQDRPTQSSAQVALARISELESVSMIPRVTREFMISALELEGSRRSPPVGPAELYESNIGYRRLKDVDDEIASLRASL